MPDDTQPSHLNRPPAGRIWLVAFLLILSVTTVIRIRLLNMPLERDEGEYAYIGQLMLDGVPPYQEAYTMKWPGTHAMYALIMALFGQTSVGIHAGLLLVTTTSTLLVFLLVKRQCGETAGAVAGAVHALLSMSPPTDGLSAHASHFVVLPALGGLLLLQNQARDRSRARGCLRLLLLKELDFVCLVSFVVLSCIPGFDCRHLGCYVGRPSA